ncbi:AAA family ATPase [Motilibacter aurantiacus]|uniref:AAA family ATPase n=1 Tax=Motilibacter aurantiacus TaxID=2714955 RepID=UPI001E65AB6E|nr:ATP-binding protein [Motilibacter aurantiacus]
MSEDEAREFARSFRRFLEAMHELGERSEGNEVVRRVQAHVEEAARRHSVVSRAFAPFEQVNVQVALDRWCEHPDRSVTVEGVTNPPHYGTFSLQQLLHGEGLPPTRLTAPELVDLPSGPARTIACLRNGLFLVDDRVRGRYAMFVRAPAPNQGDPSLQLELAGLPTAQAQEVLRELDELRSRHNVYRGQTVELSPDVHGAVTVVFPVLPRTERADVVLPEAVLARIERHAIGIAARRDALRAAGRHLKRGLLLYGPPGTGKTHTTRYLVQHLPGATVLLLSGRSLHLIGAVTALARELQPAAIVLEDVDLVAEDRGFGPGSSPVLFELLDAMDGAAADADLLFLLTTNRADLLEEALAARPGRVDVAVEIGLPDADARRRLLEVYARGLRLEVSAGAVDDVVERMGGVTASFVKELLRRAVLEALESHGAAPDGGVVVRDADLARALDDLLDSAQGVTRALLGVRDTAVDGPPAVHEPHPHTRAAYASGLSFVAEARPGAQPWR